MVADGPDQIREGLLPFPFLLGVEGAFPAEQGDLGVDDDVLAFRQVDDDIGFAQAVVPVPEALLALVFVAAAQARLFEHLLEDQLAPVALNLLVALQRPGEIEGLDADPLIELAQVADLLLQGGPLACIAQVDVVDLFLE